MITISLAMIVKNEEDVIGRCLDSVKDLVDEINIVDTGSEDKTKEIVRGYTDRIYDFKWTDNFAAARNYAFQQATMEYILWLDADDVVTEKDRKKFRQLKSELTADIDTVTMHYNLAFDAFGNVTFSNKRNRLVKRKRNFQWIGAVHEYLAAGGKTLNSDIAVTHKSLHHDSDRNLKIYEKRLADGDSFNPRDLYYFANELTDHKQYERANTFYNEFLATEKGWVEDNIAACGKLADNHLQLQQHKEQLQAIFQSFTYDKPRAEFCCRLGSHFFQLQQFQTAIFWYDLATKAILPKDHMGFVNKACFTWLPHLQLCVCYDRLGNHQKAYEHNEKARHFQPDNKHVLHNKNYLEGQLQIPDS